MLRLILGEEYKYVGDDTHYSGSSCKIVDLFEYEKNSISKAFVNVEFKEGIKWSVLAGNLEEF